MAEISAKAVKQLRDQTGAGMMECKKALAEAGGDLDKAVTVLRERGLAKAGKREGRATSEGVVGMAVVGNAGALVELGCETDFVARTDEFLKLANALAAAVAADGSLDSAEALGAAKIDGEGVDERIKAAIGTLGENIVLKRVGRVAVDGAGLVGGYVHPPGNLGVVVALAGGDEGLGGLARDLSMHVAAVDPTPVAIDRTGVDADVVARERALFEKQAAQSGKPEKVVPKIVEGRLNKFFAEICLVEQAFVKDPDKSINDLLKDASKAVGGEVTVAGYLRFKLGEEASS